MLYTGVCRGLMQVKIGNQIPKTQYPSDLIKFMAIPTETHASARTENKVTK